MFKENFFDWRIARRSIFSIIVALLVIGGLDFIFNDLLHWTNNRTPILAVLLGMWYALPFSRSWARDFVDTYSKALDE